MTPVRKIDYACSIDLTHRASKIAIQEVPRLQQQLRPEFPLLGYVVKSDVI